jgi:hypothetical protein
MKRTHILPAFTIVAPVALALALVLSACSGAAGSNGFNVGGTSGARPVGTVQASDLVTAKTGVLQSYTVQIESKDELPGSTPTTLNWTTVDMKVAAPGVFVLTSTDQTGKDKQIALRMVAAGADGYVYTSAQKKWLKVAMGGAAGSTTVLTGQVLDPNTLSAAAPAALFAAGNVVGLHEKVGGVETTHYRVTGDTLQEWLTKFAGSAVTLAAGQADVWVATQNNYLKQYNLDATLQDQDGQTVHRQVHLLVTDENKPVSVQTPAPDQVIAMPLLSGTPLPGAANAITGTAATAAAAAAATAEAVLGGSTAAGRAALDAVPAPPDSTVVKKDSLPPALQTALAGYGKGTAAQRVYLSTAQADALAAFYQQQLAGSGWSQMMSQAGKPGQPSLAMFSKDNINLMLVILPGGPDGKNVVVVDTEG